jgi:hypothetical protein
MSKVTVTIAIADDHLKQLSEVVSRLRAAGLEVQQVMAEIGVVTGTCDSSQVAGLSNVAGVESVEGDRTIRLAPPDSPIQ